MYIWCTDKYTNFKPHPYVHSSLILNYATLSQNKLAASRSHSFVSKSLHTSDFISTTTYKT